jgi:hypothetical protein
MLALGVGVVIPLANIGAILLPALVAAIFASTLAADSGYQRTQRAA